MTWCNERVEANQAQTKKEKNLKIQCDNTRLLHGFANFVASDQTATMPASAVPASENKNQVWTPDGDNGQQLTKELQQECCENPIFASSNGRETFAESKEGALQIRKSNVLRKN